jgi:LmbE family N-acetylglucosaminyl deacetylase
LYGTPTKRLVLAGGSTHPAQVLFIYDQGVKSVLSGSVRHSAKQPQPKPNPNMLATENKCLDGSVLNVVAHEDDDLLFLSPDLLDAVREHQCVTTAFLTAGDGGEGLGYANGREAGSEAAYSYMYGLPDSWHQRAAIVNDHQVTVAYLNGQPNVTLIFLNLPDGGLHGGGFIFNKLETLQALRSGRLDRIHTIDGTAAYTANELTETLAGIMKIYQPEEVHTQAYSSNLFDGDHSDHHAAGYFTKQAYQSYTGPSVLRVYAGYPARNYPVNVEGQDAADKEAAFMQYATHDPAVCHTLEECYKTSAYGGYLARQYSKLVDAHVQPE